MKRALILILTMVMILTDYPSISIAQNTEQAPPPQIPPQLVQPPPANSIVLPAATPIKIVLMEEICSQRNREGDEIIFSVEEDILIMGRVYLVKGTPVIGRVIHVKSSKGWGKSGNFDIELTSLYPIYSMPIRLTGETASSTGGRQALAVTGGAILGGFTVVGLLIGGSIKGKKARISPGISITVYASEDGFIMDIPADEMHKMVDDWYKKKIINGFLNYSWDGRRSISETMIAMGYVIDKEKITYKPLENFNYQIDVPLDAIKIASFKFQPFEEGYTSKRRTIVEMNEPARLILKAVK